MIRPADIQRTSAGTGVAHSEFNHAATEPVHLLQIWIVSNRRGFAPSYAQKEPALATRRNEWLLLAAPETHVEVVIIHQDCRLWGARIDAGATLKYDLNPKRHAWLQIARGAVVVQGQTAGAGDGLACTDEARLELTASEGAEVLLFDLA